MDKNGKRKILFIDDDRFLLDMYSLKFSKAGFEVNTADSSMGALKILRDGYVPDIMLIDIVMPEIDGLDLVATLRKEKLASNAVVIMLTNQGSPDDIGRAKKVNADGYIMKAMTIPSEVLGEVEKIWSSKISKKLKSDQN